jgi:murein DD-endopeptidase MepM/ murein hydrolase activator NlpD
MPSTAKLITKFLVWLIRAIPGLGAIILLTFLAACQPVETTVNPLPTVSSDTIEPQLSATIPSPKSTKAGSTLIPVISPTPIVSPTAIPTIASNTLQFETSTQESVPISDWRPPLYPTPWAPTLFDHFYFASPIAANEINIPVQDYRYGGMFFQDVVHTGVDIPAPKGTPVLAAGPGTVVWAGYGVYREGYDPTDPYGLAVTIEHDFGYQNQTLYTIYGHLDQIDVTEGQHVETGDTLGLVGETGVVTGPHLHFEVRIGKNSFFTTRNPELWLVPPIGWGVIAGRVMDTAGQLINDQMLIITNPKSEENSFAWSYGKTSVNSDQYYQENLVVGDIPAGTYLLRMAYGGVYFTANIEVRPGMVSYFAFRGFKGISIESPPAPGAEFTPSPLEVPIP